jgi:hypothetical protein
MKKLTLQLDELAVESFETSGAEAMRGTVRGFGDSSGCSYGSPNYTGCDMTCEFPCGESDACTPACPQVTPGCTQTSPERCPPTGGAPSCDPYTQCDYSCEFPC